MRPDELTSAYLKKADVRAEALHFYRERKAYSDVVREAQSVVELTLKDLLRSAGIEVPKIHDVGRTLENNKDLLPSVIDEHMTEICRISKRLRKERELSFYGAEDFVPTNEYELSDADQAIEEVHFVLDIVHAALGGISAWDRQE